MKPLSAILTHLYHSGFAIETVNHFLLFDYTEPAGAPEKNSLHAGSIDLDMLAAKKKIYVFITHHHKDHFMPSVLDWQDRYPDIQVIAGFDVPMSSAKNRHHMSPHQKLKVNEVMVESFESTDDGVSFYVQVDHLSFFHAGDLNWWHWKEFSSEEQVREEEDFKAAIHHLRDKNIDVAFIPVDPRLEESFYLAGQYVIETLKPTLLVPMHFGLHFEVTKRFAEMVSRSSSSIAVIEKQGQQIHFSKS